MFCPQCGSTQSDDLKFCKSCGANLQALRQVMAVRDTDDKFDWRKTWVAEMFMSGEEAVKRAAEIERLQGITPETKRRNEIKAGVITASAGVGIMITVYMVMLGIVAGGFVTDAVAQILSRVWIAGAIPVLVGTALVFNGIFVSKRSPQDDLQVSGHETPQIEPSTPSFLPPAQTNDLESDVFSVTDQTTKHLKVRR